MVELSQFFTQDHQLVLSCIQSCLALTGCQQSRLQVRLQAGNLSRGVRGSHNRSGPDAKTDMDKLRPAKFKQIINTTGFRDTDFGRNFALVCLLVQLPILTLSIAIWYTAATAKDKCRLQRIVHSAEELIGCNLQPYMACTPPVRHAGRIIADPSHPANGLCVALRSGRMLEVHQDQSHKNSFVPSANALINSSGVAPPPSHHL